ncbi:MAG TPA: hypothetical protein VJJ23_03275 [Candidatus Nanoarchaeia archaeon]|nr:hypothetical protein [Candidatus Nanoarchaeia archaeon]
MANIRIEGYRTILPNEVFGREGEPRKNSFTNVFEPTTDIIYFQRYRVPTTESILQSIITSAKEIKDRSKKDSEYTFPEIVKIIKAGRKLKFLTLEDITNLSKAEEETIDHIREGHIPEIELEQGRYHLRMLNGIFLNNYLEDMKEVIQSKGSDIYGTEIERVGYDPLFLTIRLEDAITLPEREEIEYLMKRRVKVSDVFCASGKNEDYRKLVNMVRLFYDIFTPREMKKISDTSLSLLQKTANMAIKDSTTCKKKQYLLKDIKKSSNQENSSEPFDILSLFGKEKGFDKEHFPTN